MWRERGAREVIAEGDVELGTRDRESVDTFSEWTVGILWMNFEN